MSPKNGVHSLVHLSSTMPSQCSSSTNRCLLFQQGTYLTLPLLQSYYRNCAKQPQRPDTRLLNNGLHLLDYWRRSNGGEKPLTGNLCPRHHFRLFPVCRNSKLVLRLIHMPSISGMFAKWVLLHNLIFDYSVSSDVGHNKQTNEVRKRGHDLCTM